MLLTVHFGRDFVLDFVLWSSLKNKICVFGSGFGLNVKASRFSLADTYTDYAGHSLNTEDSTNCCFAYLLYYLRQGGCFTRRLSVFHCVRLSLLYFTPQLREATSPWQQIAANDAASVLQIC